MVNVFVPVADVEQSCRILDEPRLGKQRSEIKIILAALTGVRFKQAQGEFALALPEKRGYRNHSATRMWQGHELALARFGETNCLVWAERRGHDPETGTGHETLNDMRGWVAWLVQHGADPTMPPWWGRADVHASHRSVLLFKDPDYYARFGWDDEPAYEYVWPS